MSSQLKYFSFFLPIKKHLQCFFIVFSKIPPPPTKFESKIVSHPFAPPLKFQDLVPPPFRGPPIDL